MMAFILHCDCRKYLLALKQILTAFTAIWMNIFFFKYFFYFNFFFKNSAPNPNSTSDMVSCEWTRRLSGHFSCTRTACKNLSASVNELSDEQLSGFSNISTTLRCASSFNPSSPGWRDYFKMWTLRLRLCHQSAPRSSQVMQYSVHHSLHFSKWVWNCLKKSIFPLHMAAHFNDKCSSTRKLIN